MNVNSTTTRTDASARHLVQLSSLVLGVVFALAILFQVFLAGGGIFAAGPWLEMHRSFGYMLGIFPLLLLVLALIARQPWRRVGLHALVFVLVGLQGVLINVPEKLDLPLIKALHPVNALIIFALLLLLVSAVWSDLQPRNALA
jgi:hypothetical protein